MHSLRAVIAALAFVAVSAAAHADITIYNFAAGGSDISRRITDHDVAGNVVDAHSGNIMQDGSYFYKIGEHHGGGFRWRTTGSAADGFNVYRSSDLTNWTRRGYILDPSTTWATNHCQPAGVGAGCFRPHIEKDVTNGNYGVFWSGFGAAINAASGLYYMACTAPDDSATCGTPSDITLPTAFAGDLNVFTDPADNSMYLVWSDGSSRNIYICKLQTARASCNGSEVLVAAAGGEGVWGFVRASTGKVYVGFGGLCPYCNNGATTSYAMASTPLGVYGAATQIDTSNTCGSQTMEVNKIVSGGQTTYLFMGDAWTGNENQAWATQYFYPLAFTSDAIDTMACSASVTVPGVTSAGTYPTPSSYPTAVVDQTTTANRGVFNDRCYVNATIWEMQTFTPTQANLYAVGLPLAKNWVFGTSEGGANPDGSVVVAIVNLDGSKNPTTTVASSTISVPALQYATQFTTVVLNTTLTPSTEYGLLLKGSGTTTGCFTDTISQYSNVYPSGVHRNSTNSGSTWSTNANFAMMFATYSAAAPAAPASGRLFFR